jgi:hypothetical protein
MATSRRNLSEGFAPYRRIPARARDVWNRTILPNPSGRAVKGSGAHYSPRWRQPIFSEVRAHARASWTTSRSLIETESQPWRRQEASDVELGLAMVVPARPRRSGTRLVAGHETDAVSFTGDCPLVPKPELVSVGASRHCAAADARGSSGRPRSWRKPPPQVQEIVCQMMTNESLVLP